MLETTPSNKKECVECKKSFHICKFRRFSRIYEKCNKCLLKTNPDYQRKIAEKGERKHFKRVEFARADM